MRSRCSACGFSWTALQAALASGTASGFMKDEKWVPSIRSCVHPVRGSSESEKKLKRPSASTDQTMSGEVSTRKRYRSSDAVSCS